MAAPTRTGTGKGVLLILAGIVVAVVGFVVSARFVLDAAFESGSAIPSVALIGSVAIGVALIVAGIVRIVRSRRRT